MNLVLGRGRTLFVAFLPGLLFAFGVCVYDGGFGDISCFLSEIIAGNPKVHLLPACFLEWLFSPQEFLKNKQVQIKKKINLPSYCTPVYRLWN